MNILAIETSCDDTCVSVIKASDKKKFNFDILSNIVSSQVEVHRKWGGVYPALAKREHQNNLVSVLEKALRKARMLKKSGVQFKNKNLKKILEREERLYQELEKFFKKYQKPEIDLIAVTIGPGLEPCLWVGVNFAKALSCAWQIPVVPVNHIEAHILSNLVSGEKISFPAISLIVSGGHTQIILVKEFGKYRILGETRDDAAGECFDKTARILGLGYPGGPEIAKMAKKGKAKLPRPMLNTKDYDFSFSGLKTAVLYNFKKQPVKVRKSKKYIQEMCYEIQQAIIDVLIKKTIKAAKNYKAKTVILGGGVTANKELRKQLGEKIKKEMPKTKRLIPNTQLCTDNAVMAGITGYFNRMKGKAKSWQKIRAEANLRIG